MGERTAMKSDPAHIVVEGLGRQESEKPTYLPNAYMQHGAVCKGKPSGNGCFLDDDQRGVLITQLEGRINDARDAYLAAITAMQVELLVQADDDLPWLAMLLLDVATAGIASAASRGLKLLVQGGANKLARVAFDAGIQASSGHWAATGLAVVQRLGDKQFEQGAKLAMDPLKKLVQGQVKDELALARTAKTEISAELSALRTQVRVGFQQYRETTSGVANDGELLTLFLSFDAAIQSEQHYAALLSAKMMRFRKSGVTMIGRMTAGRDARLSAVPELENEMGVQVLRDTRVVWVQYAEGGPSVLRFQQHDGDRVHSVLHPGGEHHPRKTRATFGPAEPLTEKPELGRPVPVEFQAAALSRHEQVWGSKPSTIQVRDPDWGFFNRVVNESVQNPRPTVPDPDSPNGIFNRAVNDSLHNTQKTTPPAVPVSAKPVQGPYVDALPFGAPVAHTKKEPT